MTKLLAVIATQERTTQAVLASEALRKAAAGLGLSIDVETKIGAAVQGALTPASIAESVKTAHLKRQTS